MDDQKEAWAGQTYWATSQRWAGLLHLLCVDDCLLLAEAIIAEAEVVNEVLHDSYCMSGQQVNIGKSQVIFGEGVSPRQFDLSKEYS